MSDPEKKDGPAPEEKAPMTAEQLEKQRADEEKAERQALSNKFSQFGYVVMPSEAKPPILDAAVRRALAEWMAEMNDVRGLRSVGMTPRKRVMLEGPPGCGKTTLAHHVAARMGLPMVTVMANQINTSFVGESAANVGKIFRAARQASNGVVLFFDEFDAIARNRGNRKSHVESDGATISLLAELDRHEGMVFAATNVQEGIDPAVHRRFNIKIDINLPGELERQAIVRLYLSPLNVADVVVNAIAAAMENASPALIKDLCEAIKRGLVLGPKLQLDTGLGALVRRATTTLKPHDDMTVPKLWGGVAEQVERLDVAAEGNWPPELPVRK